MDRKVALKIAEQEWACVVPEKLPPPGTYPDFAAYVSEKIEMSLATAVKNRPGFIREALRENYQDPQVQKERQVRAEKAKQKQLKALEEELNIKRNNILRQAIHAEPELVERAAERIQSYIVRQRLELHETALAAYQKGGMVAAEIHAILAAEFCQALIAPVLEQYEDEKTRILAEGG